MATIAVDIDDVLIPFFQSMAEWHNKNFGTSIRANMLQSTWVSDSWGGEEEYWINKCNQYHQDAKTGSSTIPVDPAAKQGLTRLKSDGHSLLLVTSRPARHRAFAERWVDANLDGIVDGLHMCENPAEDGGTFSMKKGELCKRIGASTLIDDNTEYVQDAHKNDLHALLFGAHSWNRTSPHPCRTRNWQEVIQHINSECQ